MLRSVGFTFISKLLTAVINFAVVILLSQYLGPAGKGQSSFYLVILTTALIVAELGGGATAVFLMREFSIKNIQKVLYVWSVPCAILVSATFLFINRINISEWIVLVICCWLESAININQQFFLGRQKFGWYNFINLLQAAAVIVATFCFFYFDEAAPFNYLLALLTAWSICFIAGHILVQQIKTGAPQAEDLRKLIRLGFRHGISNQAAHVMQIINTRTGYYLLEPVGLGIYSNAASVTEAALLLSSSIGNVLYAKVAATTDMLVQQSLYRRSFWINAIGMAAGLLVLILLPPGIYTWLFGAGFYGMQTVIIILAPGIGLYSCFLITGYYNSGTGNFILNGIAAGIALCITIILYAIVFIGKVEIGPVVTGVITSASYFGIFMASMLIYFRRTGSSIRHFIQMPSLKEIKEMM